MFQLDKKWILSILLPPCLRMRIEALEQVAREILDAFFLEVFKARLHGSLSNLPVAGSWN